MTVRDYLKNTLGLTDEEFLNVAVRLAERHALLQSAGAQVSAKAGTAPQFKLLARWGKLDTEQREAAIIERWVAGRTSKEITNELRVSGPTFYKFCHVRKLKRDKHAPATETKRAGKEKHVSATALLNALAN
jgi:FixJ family two-component response regulator